MKNVTEMTNTEKSQNKADILYITQIQRYSGINGIPIRLVYLQLQVYIGVREHFKKNTTTKTFRDDKERFPLQNSRHY